MAKKETEMTEAQVRRRIKGLPTEKQRAMVCALVGHSKIVSLCFGYVHCGRCDAQIGDRLGGVFDTSERVVVGHNCPTCRDLYTKLDWKSTFLTPDPFAVVPA